MGKIAIALLMVNATAALAQPGNVLYVTHSAGFKHDNLPLSQQVLEDLGARSGKFHVTATEDLSLLNDLTKYSAVVFFTSGELALSTGQKRGLLEFVRKGGGFAGIHSATDTLYTWPEYGELIGGRFDGHPWTQEVRIDVEDPEHPLVRHLGSSFSITEEIYQFREISRDRVRVLMTLDTTSVDMSAAGINRQDSDFALAWTRLEGGGRVFYSALGHFESTWRDARFQRMLEEALLWITGQSTAEAQPRRAAPPSIVSNGVGNAATMQPPMTISPGSFVSIYGTNLSSGASAASNSSALSPRLAGTRVFLNGKVAPLVFASPGQINLLVPFGIDPLECNGKPCLEVMIEAAGGAREGVQVGVAPFTPGIFVAEVSGKYATLWATGLGAIERRGDLDWTIVSPRVTVNGFEANVSFSGLSPGWPGLYQVNVEVPPLAVAPFEFSLAMPPAPI